MTESVPLWAAYSPGKLLKNVATSEAECWERLCDSQGTVVQHLRARGYTVVLGIFVPTMLWPTGRRVPDLTGQEHLCQWQGVVRARDKQLLGE